MCSRRSKSRRKDFFFLCVCTYLSLFGVRELNWFFSLFSWQCRLLTWICFPSHSTDLRRIQPDLFAAVADFTEFSVKRTFHCSEKMKMIIAITFVWVPDRKPSFQKIFPWASNKFEISIVIRILESGDGRKTELISFIREYIWATRKELIK